MEVESTPHLEVRDKRRKRKLNMVLYYQECVDRLLKSSEKYGKPTCWEPIRWYLVMKIMLWRYFLDRNSLTVNAACQTAGTLNVQQHSSEELNTLPVKCYRQRVWETRYSGATGWEHRSHFSDVWCSSLLQLTKGSNWQRESSFRCQMWPHWM